MAQEKSPIPYERPDAALAPERPAELLLLEQPQQHVQVTEECVQGN